MPIRRRKKNGQMGMGLATKPEAREAMNRLAMQIPGEFRDLRLRHPRTEVWFYVARDDFDRSNGWCCLEDLLWQYGVIVDDCVREFNAELVLHPAELGDEWRTVVMLTPQTKPPDQPVAQRYINPKRAKRLLPKPVEKESPAWDEEEEMWE
jgi:hypothetical protein